MGNNHFANISILVQGPTFECVLPLLPHRQSETFPDL